MKKRIIFTTFCLAFLISQPLFAGAEGAGRNWRPTYDAVMMCVNFVILVLILVKLLKNPIKNFFQSQRDSISQEIEHLTHQKEKTRAELDEVQKRVTAGDAHIQEVRKRLVEEGESIKEKIIENARQQSEYMLAAAQKNISNQFLEARKAFRTELIELAVSSASDKLVNEIENNDHKKLVNQFLYDLAETQP